MKEEKETEKEVLLFKARIGKEFKKGNDGVFKENIKIKPLFDASFGLYRRIVFDGKNLLLATEEQGEDKNFLTLSCSALFECLKDGGRDT